MPGLLAWAYREKETIDILAFTPSLSFLPKVRGLIGASLFLALFTQVDNYTLYSCFMSLVLVGLWGK
jgi:hypothetical protein